MFQKAVVLVTALTLLFVGVSLMTAQDRATKSPDREADKQAIDKVIKESIQAFNNRDANAMAAHWTSEGEYILNDGTPIRGQANIQKGYVEFFKTLKGKPKVEVQMDNLRFTSNDTAVSEVTLRLKNDQGELLGSSCATRCWSGKAASGRWPLSRNGIATIRWTTASRISIGSSVLGAWTPRTAM